MRTVATVMCISASATLAGVVVPATRGKLKEASRTRTATAVQMVIARVLTFSSNTSTPRAANEPTKAAISTSPSPTS